MNGYSCATICTLVLADASQFLDVLDEILVVLLVVDRRRSLHGDLVARCVAVELNFGAQLEDELLEVLGLEESVAFGLIVLAYFANFLRCFADYQFGHVSEASCPTVRCPVGNAHLQSIESEKNECKSRSDSVQSKHLR